ncbi:hypothetical protein MUG91_G19n26 [Manis pentadactyla]|nr:hypothetical protein MUG91_G19n26 [Manis pentadactyla]
MLRCKGEAQLHFRATGCLHKPIVYSGYPSVGDAQETGGFSTRKPNVFYAERQNLAQDWEKYAMVDLHLFILFSYNHCTFLLASRDLLPETVLKDPSHQQKNKTYGKIKTLEHVLKIMPCHLALKVWIDRKREIMSLYRKYLEIVMIDQRKETGKGREGERKKVIWIETITPKKESKKPSVEITSTMLTDTYVTFSKGARESMIPLERVLYKLSKALLHNLRSMRC